MRALLRENVAVIIGITLPIVVVVLFVLATEVPKLFVEPPRHELLLTAQMSNRWHERPVRIEITTAEGRVRVRAFRLEPQQGVAPMYPVPRLFVWSPGEDELREIEIVVPDDLEALADGTELAVPELAGRSISTNDRAPDGYEFRRISRGGAGIFGMLFGGGSPRVVVEKGGATLAVEPPRDTSIWNIEFLGWIVD